MAGIAAFGTTVSPTIAELKNVSGPGGSRDVIDASYHGSNLFKEYVGGLIDGGSVTLEGNLETTALNLFTTYATSSSATNFVITFPGGAGTLTFPGFLESFDTGAPIDGMVSFSASIKVAGKPT